MNRDLFDGLPHFLAVARHGSFTAAAEALDISPTAMSKAIRALETRYQTKLFQRTTRHVRLTDAGAELFQRLDRAANEISDALATLSTAQSVPAGTLRLTIPRSAMRYPVLPIIERFQELYPRVVLDISLNDALVDLVADGYDAGIRLGEAIDKDMIAVRLTPGNRWAIAASPDYLARSGTPKRLEDLSQHKAILFRFQASRTLHIWEFERRGRTIRVKMPQQVIVDDRLALVRLVKAGIGLGYVQEPEVQEEVERGELQLLFADQIGKDDGIFLYFPTAMQSQPKLRAFIDVVRTIHAR
ncbi:MAG TPA: LysR substrate-binding domain-containing protein [Mesorhizobium sp.]|jgi:DNA-binding transcriptional LysR family regulator|uniref:LysR substrate-binding domain-containing protein n=1 Tax=Mesorhizobium sp. TaxID=1871066 RepID=UPI002DDDB167|nr:LysR substrate-binding domain-containing protein [Mesorhizobium sp.]HEV2502775.1 LysR substrate-binding domain-containing protein [Mesorhizobium sp.]